MVHAAETSLQELLEGTKQYLVPLYQRTYAWSRAQHARLWDDLVKLAEDRSSEDKDATHFIGSLVLAPSPNIGPTGVQQYLVVDGQQRLTTLSLLLCAIRDHRAETEDPHHRDRINEQYLINKWKSGALRFKLLPTQVNRASYQACLEKTPHAGSGDPIGDAYRYFRSQLVTVDDPDDPHDIERLEEAVISGLSLVSVTAQTGDNVHRIFESLNNTGLHLTQSDLLRNYLFMRLPTRGENVYESLWLPLQNSMSSDELETLFWLDLVHRDPRAKQTDTYARHQDRLNRLSGENEIEAEIHRFTRLGNLFIRILRPQEEPDPAIRRGLERLAEWGTTTVYPLLLHMLALRESGSIDPSTAARTMNVIESFMVRRLLTGRVSTGMNRVMLGAVPELRPDLPLDEAVRDYFSTGRKYFSTDAELTKGMTSQPFYFNGRGHQRTLVLRWLEEALGSKEPVAPERLTIEHVLPQSLSPSWRKTLAAELGAGQDVDQVHAEILHTIGNLTLTGYNSELSNSDFAIKRDKLIQSGILMNQEIAEQPVWGRTQIAERSALLARRAVQIWTGPAKPSPSSTNILWQRMNQALAALPAGTWTTYGDLAVLIGTHPVPVGLRLSSHPAPNAHRVLQANGTVSPAFTWLEPERTDDPLDILRQEGVQIDPHGRAEPSQRVGPEELAELIGLLPDALGSAPDPDPAGDASLRDRFVEQLSAQNDVATFNAVLGLLDVWVNAGGALEYGSGGQTSCFLIARTATHQHGSLSPIAIFPSGRAEVVFQYMVSRPPFDDPAMREELRDRLNRAAGISLPAGKLQMRPGFHLDVLAVPEQALQVRDALLWFLRVGASAEAAPAQSPRTGHR